MCSNHCLSICVLFDNVIIGSLCDNFMAVMCKIYINFSYLELLKVLLNHHDQIAHYQN
jgi:hypothetical protein